MAAVCPEENFKKITQPPSKPKERPFRTALKPDFPTSRFSRVIFDADMAQLREQQLAVYLSLVAYHALLLLLVKRDQLASE